MSPASPDPDRPVDPADAAHPPHPGADGPAVVAPPTGVGMPAGAGGPIDVDGPGGVGMPAGVVAPARWAPARMAGALGLLTLLGVPLGLLWAALAPGTPVIKSADGAVYAEAQPEQPIAADGWFSLLGLGFGILVALGLWFLLRRHRGPLGLLVGVLGSLGATVVAWQLGRRIGLAEFQRLLVEAPVGRHFDKPVDLRAGGVDQVLGVLPVPYGNLLLPAFAVAVTYTLLAGWSRWPSLRPEPEQVSWVPAGTPVPATAPEPPAPDAAEPPRG
ncbi:DUF2567 domain-containing protein [Micromonospora sagamiensis]|uniref:DUF2567 domain-containing protein n=1 Tax=Micromonospora sagamiensis TaxID=47875 RepID=A0A562WD08_9ACTN|nr:hypothetical protein JD81_01673 [Micromonospora sagamiensis]BCL12941.1 hypothetical protein GCM10017556_06800 [Micromonospora sagamiensis]